MSETFDVGDRVTWRSTRADRKGNRLRAGTVLKIYQAGDYAFVKPDKGQGGYQYITLGRLRKVKPAPQGVTA